jgi:hypothetical protein
MDLALLNAEIANGMYKKPLTDLAKEIHYEPLPDEVRAVIIAWRGSAGDYCLQPRSSRWLQRGCRRQRYVRRPDRLPNRAALRHR